MDTCSASFEYKRQARYNSLVMHWDFDISIGYNRLLLPDAYFCRKHSVIAIYLTGSGRLALNFDSVYPDYKWLSTAPPNTNLERIPLPDTVGVYANALIDIKYYLNIFNINIMYEFSSLNGSISKVFGNFEGQIPITRIFSLSYCKKFEIKRLRKS